MTNYNIKFYISILLAIVLIVLLSPLLLTIAIIALAIKSLIIITYVAIFIYIYMKNSSKSKKTFTYKDISSDCYYSNDNKVWYGYVRVNNAKTLLKYSGDSPRKARQSFRKVVVKYLKSK
jgi:hypothetical protein